MPVALMLPLRNGAPPVIERAHLPELFLRYLAIADASLANNLRQAPVPRPFALSHFFRRDAVWRWRVALLDDTLTEPFLAGVTQAPREESLLAIDITGIERLQISYEALLDQAASAPVMRLGFISPTSFHTGLVTYPLPDPMGMFQSWWGRWNAFAPVKMDRVLLDVGAVHLAISHCNLHTQHLDLGVGREVGFTGEVTLRVVQFHKLGDEVLRCLNALAYFAIYCGTGQRTAQGMGQTRCYPSRQSEET